MIIIIDTNILLSAILGNETAIGFLGNDKYKFYASPEIIDEYRTLIRRKKFKISIENIEYWDNFIKQQFIIQKANNRIKLSRDYQDAKFIELANEIKAEYLITNDKKLLNATNFTATKIVNLEVFDRITRHTQNI